MGNKHGKDQKISHGFAAIQRHEMESYWKLIKKQTPDGRVDKRAFQLLFPGSATIADQLFQALDASSTGFIDHTEYVRGMSIFCCGDPKAKLEFIFNLYDTDKNGFLTEAEYVRITLEVLQFSGQLSQSIGEEAVLLGPQEAEKQAREHFRSIDRNADSKISKHEFIEYAHTFPGLELVRSLDTKLRSFFMPQKLTLKIAAIGLAGCGKTAFIQRALGINGRDYFNYKYEHEMHFENGGKITLEIQDSDEHNRSLALVGSDVVLLVYSVSETSAAEVRALAAEAQQTCPTAALVLLGSKIDLRHASGEFGLQLKDGYELMRSLDGRGYFEVSAHKSEDDTVTAVLEGVVNAVIPPAILRPRHRPVNVALVGTALCGKTSLLQVWLGRSQPSFGYKYYCQKTVDETTFHLSIVDSDTYNRTLAYPGADLVIIVYPVTNDHPEDLQLIAKEASEGCPEAMRVLVVSKVDLRSPDHLTPEQLFQAFTPAAGQDAAKKLGASVCIEVSQTDANSCNEALEQALRAMIPQFTVTPDIDPVEAPREKRVALWPFEPSADETDCLPLEKFAVIEVLDKSAGEWWLGRLADGREGYFPSDYTGPHAQ